MLIKSQIVYLHNLELNTLDFILYYATACAVDIL